MNTAKNLFFPEDQSICRRQLFESFDRFKKYSNCIPMDVIRQELGQLPLQAGDLLDIVCYSDATYQRIVLAESQVFKALLLCWKPGQQSPIHNHIGSDCFVKVVHGTASEIVFEQNDRGVMTPTMMNTMRKGDYGDTNNEYAHMMANFSKSDPLITLHVYTPPLKQMETFLLQQTIFDDYHGKLERSQAAATHSGIWQIGGVG